MEGLSYKERLGSLECRRLKGDLIEVYKIMTGIGIPRATQRVQGAIGVRQMMLPSNTNEFEHIMVQVDVGGPGQIVGDHHSQELDPVDHLHFSTIDADRGEPSTPLPEVDDQLLRFADADGEIV
eukprot:g43004.t1